jgi:hypothetical protein
MGCVTGSVAVVTLPSYDLVTDQLRLIQGVLQVHLGLMSLSSSVINEKRLEERMAPNFLNML